MEKFEIYGKFPHVCSDSRAHKTHDNIYAKAITFLPDERSFQLHERRATQCHTRATAIKELVTRKIDKKI
jgi:hypothetical protein